MPTSRFMISVCTAAIGASFQFYSLGVVNPAQTIIEAWINDTYAARNGDAGLSRSGITLFFSFTTSCICLGACAGALIMRPFAERLGRRNGLIALGVICVIAGALEASCKAAASPELLIIGRFMLGMCMGLSSGLVPMYLMEISPVRYRGAATTAHQIVVAFSDWFSLFLALPFILGSEQLWPVAFAFAAVPALLLLIVLPWMPESPRFLLINRHKRNAAFKAVKALVGPKEAKQVYESLLREAVINSTAGVHGATSGIAQLFKRRSLRTPLTISILVMVAQQFTGCAAVFSFSTNMFLQANLDDFTAQISTLGIGIAYFVCVLPSIWLIESKGRRFLSLFQLSGCFVCLGLLSISIWLQDAYQLQWASYGAIASLVLFMCVYGVGSPIPWMITGELFAQQHRASAMTLSTLTAWTLAFLVQTLYLPLQNAVGASLSFLPFMVVLLVVIIALAILLPETKNREIDDIVREFRLRSRTMSRTLTMSYWKGREPSQQLDWLLEGEEGEEEEEDLPTLDLTADGPGFSTKYGSTRHKSDISNAHFNIGDG